MVVVEVILFFFFYATWRRCRRGRNFGWSVYCFGSIVSLTWSNLTMYRAPSILCACVGYRTTMISRRWISLAWEYRSLGFPVRIPVSLSCYFYSFFFYFLFRPPFTRFFLIFPLIYPRLTLDVSVSYVAQLDIVGSGMQILDNDALESSVGVEALGLMSNRLVSIGDTSLR